MRDDPFYHQDDPTDPIRPPSPSQKNQRGNKLILGSFRDPQAQRQPERKPYQYPQQDVNDGKSDYDLDKTQIPHVTLKKDGPSESRRPR